MEERQKKLEVLVRLAADLNESDILWALGASAMLFFRGIVEDFHDIDLLVSEEDVSVAREILLRHGTLQSTEHSSQYHTRCFLEFDVDGVEIDLIAGMVIDAEVQHSCPLLVEEIDACVDLQDQAISLHSLEVWRQYYLWMGRMNRVQQIDRWISEQIK